MLLTWFLLPAAILLPAALYLSGKMRYGFTRRLILSTFAWLQGVKPVFVTDVKLAREVLLRSDCKGLVLERLLATPAWHPVLSLESVDGDQWSRMKRSFLELQKILPPTAKLTTLMRAKTKQWLSTDAVLDSPALVLIVVSSFVEWLFDRPFLPEWDFVLDATWQWRKDIAQKAASDPVLKQRTVDWAIELIRSSSSLFALFGNDWTHPEYFSLILQPFIISPAINYSDIAVFARRLHDPSRPIVETLRRALHEAHPFPILERYLPDGLHDCVIEPGSHVFIPLDTMGELCPFDPKQASSIAFGVGARACAGRTIAMQTLDGLLSVAIEHPRFRPEVGHVWSGRDNDGAETFAETLFQVRRLVYILWKLIFCRVQCKYRRCS